MLYYERKFKRQACDLIIGVDEAGRGSLAGPVVAAAVALMTWAFKSRIDDSKKLTWHQREKAYPEIISKSLYGVGIVDEKIIDRVNILVATRMAMEQAITQLLEKKGSRIFSKIQILVDGKIKLNAAHPVVGIIKGDCKSKSIACASILAKVTRDRIMADYHSLYPEYGFINHKGYGTPRHMEAVGKFGPSEIHRISFCLAPRTKRSKTKTHPHFSGAGLHSV